MALRPCLASAPCARAERRSTAAGDRADERPIDDRAPDARPYRSAHHRARDGGAPSASKAEQPARRLGGRDARLGHLRLQLRQQPPDVGPGAEVLLQAVAQHRPQPRLLLLASSRCELAGLARACCGAPRRSPRPRPCRSPSSAAHGEHRRVPVRRSRDGRAGARRGTPPRHARRAARCRRRPC